MLLQELSRTGYAFLGVEDDDQGALCDVDSACKVNRV